MIPASYRALRYGDCTHTLLAELSVRFGVDAAATFFYERIREAPFNHDLVRALDGTDSRTSDLSSAIRGRTDRRAQILIAPAFFYRERPDVGGDGAVIQSAARSAGLHVEVPPVASAGSAAANALALRRLLPERCIGPTVLVSLSKGAADVRLALESMPRIPDDLRAWVIVSGLAHGTPAVDRALRQWWSRWTVRMLLARAGASLDAIDGLSASSS